MRIQVILKAEEKDRLEVFCNKNHISVSSFCRMQIMGAIEDYEANPRDIKRPGDLF